LLKKIEAISNEPITQRFIKWTVKNKSDKTDLKLWQEGIKNLSQNYGDTIVDMVENIGK